MTSKERMMLAVRGEKPDRLPVTVHQWQGWHLDHYMDGISTLEAFERTGMDAAIQYFEAMGQFWIPDAEKHIAQSDEWRDEITVVDPHPDHKVLHHTIHTPGGTLTYKTEGNRKTTWITEYLIKQHEDVDLIARYMPVAKLDKGPVEEAYDEVGDRGILRGFVWGDQAGCWQHACCLMDIQDLILEAFDNPDWVHRLLSALLEKKLRFIEESLSGAKFDLIETGGGASSDTLISPSFHREFCLPYDREMHRALHDAGHLVTYHTCGGMMHILDLRSCENETDASETLTPPSAAAATSPTRRRSPGAPIDSRRSSMIGGMDQHSVLTSGTPEQVRAEVHRLFEGSGKDGAYTLSCSDHFFDTPAENLMAYAEAARECRY